jgi:hypothetical protein
MAGRAQVLRAPFPYGIKASLWFADERWSGGKAPRN